MTTSHREQSHRPKVSALEGTAEKCEFKRKEKTVRCTNSSFLPH